MTLVRREKRRRRIECKITREREHTDTNALHYTWLFISANTYLSSEHETFDYRNNEENRWEGGDEVWKKIINPSQRLRNITRLHASKHRHNMTSSENADTAYTTRTTCPGWWWRRWRTLPSAGEVEGLLVAAPIDNVIGTTTTTTDASSLAIGHCSSAPPPPQARRVTSWFPFSRRRAILVSLVPIRAAATTIITNKTSTQEKIKK